MGERSDWSRISVNDGTDNQKVFDVVTDLQKFGGPTPHRKKCGLGKIAQWLRANGEPSVKKVVFKLPPAITPKHVKKELKKHTMNIACAERVRNIWKWVIGRAAFVAGEMLSYKDKCFNVKNACGEVLLENFEKLTSEEKMKAEKK